jgi:hypothetical protein
MGFVIVFQSNLATIRNSVEIIANVIHDCRPILVQSLKQIQDKNVKCKHLVTYYQQHRNRMHQLYGKAVPWLRQLVTGLSPRQPGLTPR